MDTAIITTIITAVTTLAVSMGTWHVTAKQARKKETEAMTTLIESYRDELRGKMVAVQNSVAQVDATVQQKVSVIDVKIDNLAEKVEKHNEVIDRTYKLEGLSGRQDEQIDDIRRRLANLEAKVQ